jgi:hypothetical protein
MYNALIAKDATYAAKTGGGLISGINELDLLADGAIAIFTERNVLVTAATTAAALLGVQQFWVAVGSYQASPVDGVNKAYIRKSYSIDRDAYVQEYCAYVAPVLQRTIVGEDGAGNGDMNLPTTLIAGTTADISIVDTSDGTHQPNMVKHYDHVVTTIDTKQTVIQALADAINADPQSIVTATVLLNTGVKVGLQLDAKTLEGTFKVGTDETIRYADKFYDINGGLVVNYGKGTPAILSRLEKRGQIASQGSGNYQYLQNKFFAVDSVVGSTATYNTWNFMWTQEARANSITSMNVTEQESLLAVPSGAATLLAALTTIFGVLSLGQSTGSGSSSI